eukprot:1234149-Rhodomonas_salina.1
MVKCLPARTSFADPKSTPSSPPSINKSRDAVMTTPAATDIPATFHDRTSDPRTARSSALIARSASTRTCPSASTSSLDTLLAPAAPNEMLEKGPTARSTR